MIDRRDVDLFDVAMVFLECAIQRRRGLQKPVILRRKVDAGAIRLGSDGFLNDVKPRITQVAFPNVEGQERSNDNRQRRFEGLLTAYPDAVGNMINRPAMLASHHRLQPPAIESVIHSHGALEGVSHGRLSSRHGGRVRARPPRVTTSLLIPPHGICSRARDSGQRAPGASPLR